MPWQGRKQQVRDRPARIIYDNVPRPSAIVSISDGIYNAGARNSNRTIRLVSANEFGIIVLHGTLVNTSRTECTLNGLIRHFVRRTRSTVNTIKTNAIITIIIIAIIIRDNKYS